MSGRLVRHEPDPSKSTIKPSTATKSLLQLLEYFVKGGSVYGDQARSLIIRLVYGLTHAEAFIREIRQTQRVMCKELEETIIDAPPQPIKVHKHTVAANYRAPTITTPKSVEHVLAEHGSRICSRLSRIRSDDEFYDVIGDDLSDALGIQRHRIYVPKTVAKVVRKCLWHARANLLLENVFDSLTDEELVQVLDAVNANPAAFYAPPSGYGKRPRVDVTSAAAVLDAINTATSSQYWMLRWKRQVLANPVYQTISMRQCSFTGYAAAAWAGRIKRNAITRHDQGMVAVKPKKAEITEHLLADDCVSLVLMSGEYVLAAVVHQRIDVVRIFQLVRPVGNFYRNSEGVHYNSPEKFINEVDCSTVSKFLRRVPEVPKLSLRDPFLLGINTKAHQDDKKAIEIEAWYLPDFTIPSKRAKIIATVNKDMTLMDDYIKYMYYMDHIPRGDMAHIPLMYTDADGKLIFVNFSIQIKNGQIELDEWKVILCNETDYKKQSPSCGILSQFLILNSEVILVQINQFPTSDLNWLTQDLIALKKEWGGNPVEEIRLNLATKTCERWTPGSQIYFHKDRIQKQFLTTPFQQANDDHIYVYDNRHDVQQLVQTHIRNGTVHYDAVFPKHNFKMNETDLPPGEELFDAIYYPAFHRLWHEAKPCEAAQMLPDFRHIKITRRHKLDLRRLQIE